MAEPGEISVEPPTPFDRIVCATDARASSGEAALQAAILATPATELTFVSVVGAAGHGDAEAALAAATRIAARRGVTASARQLRSENAAEALIEASAGADLLVVGSGRQAGDVVLGSTASAALHAAPLPVLIARLPPEPEGFPSPILVATDGSPEALRGIEVAGRVAQARASELALVHVSDGRSPPLAAASAGTIIEEVGDPATRIAEVAACEGAALLVIGSRGLGRARVLGSVGERVAHEAPCSVLVVRPAG